MKENINYSHVLWGAALVLFAVISRVINVEFGIWGNFACVGAISLFSGNVIKNKSLAYLVPLAAYFLSDLFIQLFTKTQGFYGISQFFVYASMLLVVFLGSKMGDAKALKVTTFSLGGSFIFWVVSNFGVWFANGMTPVNSPMHEPGLTLGFTYLRALPFYNNFSSELFVGTFVGDLVYNGLLFGAFALISNRVFAPKSIA